MKNDNKNADKDAASVTGLTAANKAVPRKDAYLQSLEKGLATLAAFTAKKSFWTIADIAQHTGQDRATSRRALLTLAHLGYLKNDGKHFSLTAKVLGFGYQYLAALPFWAIAHPVLEELSTQLGETVSVGVIDGADVVFILRVPAKRLITFDPSTGSRVPAHVHSLGHILLSTWSAPDLEAFLREVTYTKFTRQSVETEAELRATIDKARKQGWAFTSSQHEENLGGLSVPLLDARGRVLAALNVNFIMDSDAESRAIGTMLPRLQLAARRITQSMTTD